MEGLLQDVRYAVRMIARRPALSVIIVLDARAWHRREYRDLQPGEYRPAQRRLPYPEPERLVE